MAYSATPDVEGITISGGEPFQQAGAVAALCEAVRDAGGSVMVFTGFDLSELTGDEHQRLLDSTDILVAGRYDRSQPAGGEGWRGSLNQQVHFLSTRYGPQELPQASAFEVHVEPDGRLVLTGFPPTGLRAADLVAVQLGDNAAAPLGVEELADNSVRTTDLGTDGRRPISPD